MSEQEEDILDLWNNAFKLVELAFEKDNINEGLNDAIGMITAFTGASDIQIYQLLADGTSKNFVNLWGEDKNIEHFYIDGQLVDNADEIVVPTKNNTYVVIISDNDIIDERLNQKYFSALERVFKIIFDKFELEEKLTNTTITDSLTKVGNRYYYDQFIEELSQRSNLDITYSLIDLFRLKYVNDTFGHKGGDDYVITVANLLKETLDDEDMLFRIGGDEFVTISIGKKKDLIEAQLEGINSALNEESLGLDLPFPLSINYGIVEGNLDIQTAYLQADELMAQHKTKTYQRLNIDRRR